ncbi:DUF2256 domain-containing protein [Mucilaginibacter pocheonensis]
MCKGLLNFIKKQEKCWVDVKYCSKVCLKHK